MKPKDASFFQLHIEKLTVGAAVAFFAAIGFFYFLGSPYSVKLNGANVSPGEAPALVREAADRLAGKLQIEQSELPEVKIAEYAANFSDRSKRPPASADLLAVTLSNAGIPSVVVEPPNAYYLPSAPLPTEFTARSHFAVLGDVSNQLVAEAPFAMIAVRSPRDFRYITVGAKWDMDALVDRYEAETANPVPRNWWQSMMDISGVYLQRQELDPVTGQWVNETLVPVLPDQIAYLPPTDGEALEPWSQEDAEMAIRRIKENQEQIVRPEFPVLADQSVWLPPDSKIRSLTSEEHRKLDRLRRKIKTTEKQLEIVRKQLERMHIQQQNEQRREQRRNAGGRGRKRQPTGGGMMGGGGPGGGMMGGGVGGGRSSRSSGTRNRGQTAPRTANDAVQELRGREQELRQSLFEFEDERDQILGIEADIVKRRNREMPMGGGFGMMMGMGGAGGYGPMGGPIGGPMMGGMPMGSYGPMGVGGFPPEALDPTGGFDPRGLRNLPYESDQEQVDEDGRRTVKVWAHDLTVEPGKTYRYRVLVSVLNPLFRQTRVQPEQREQHYNRLVLGPDPEELAAAEWSEPVEVDPELHFFLVGGSPQQGAQVEVWRIFNGELQHKEFSVEPGDPIGGSTDVNFNGNDIELEMRVDSLVVDLVSTEVRGRRDVGMYILQPESNRLRYRTVAEDSNSPIRRRLQNESEIYRQLNKSKEPLAARE